MSWFVSRTYWRAAAAAIALVAGAAGFGASEAIAAGTATTATAGTEAGSPFDSDSDAGAAASAAQAAVNYTHQTSCGGGSFCNVDGASSAQSYASLATGKLGAQASVTDTYGRAYADASWNDAVSFLLPTGLESIDVSFAFLVEGTVAEDPDGFHGFGQAFWSLQIQEYQPFTIFNQLAVGGVIGEPDIGFIPQSDVVDPFVTLSSFGADGVTGTITLRSGYTYFVSALLTATNRADFFHTATFSFPTLPDGVTLRSESGVFLTGGAVPEPATWALLIGGFGAAGAMLRRRRRSTMPA